jgi:ATP phosphoribosyltransferase
MSDDAKLIIGMPAGSLANPNRGGNLVHLLKSAGFPTKGYEDGGPTAFPLHSVLMGWDGRPQEFGAQLAVGELDIAIGGDDWVQERVLEYRYAYGQEIALTKVLPLKRGKVRLVIIANPFEGTFDEWMSQLLREKSVVTMVSEMPYLAVDWFLKKARALGFGESHAGHAVQKYKTPPQVTNGVVVYESWGKTEAKVVNGGADLGLEITQSGSAIANYGLSVGEEVMQSETGIWANPSIKENPAKHELARMFLLNLYGAINGENKVLLLFNTRKEQTDAIVDYLRVNKLFADEPTMNSGVNFNEFSVQMDTNNLRLPLAKVRYELARLGATGIDTVPLDSCIPGIDTIDF